MKPLIHTIGKQTLSVTCDAMDDALALRPRVADWNHLYLLPVIERVFSEVDIEGHHIRIDRLAVDLGDIPVSDFENAAPARLYRELKEAVLRAIASPFESRTQPEQLARIELLEFYLLRGTLPFHTVSASSFSMEELFAELAAGNPAALARLVRKTASHEYVLKRIVYQLSDVELRRLVAVLEPEHAALILAYMVDLGAIQHEQAITAADEGEFDRLLWLLVLSYLVHEAGSQFNRKVFVQSLIIGFAERQSLDYDQMLAMLGDALERTLVRRNIPSSLPAVIAELIQESNSDTQENAALSEMEPAALARLVRARGANAAWLRELVNALDEAALVALLNELEPVQAQSIVSLLSDLPLPGVTDTSRRAAPSAKPPAFIEMEPAELARLVRARGASSVWLRELVSALDERALIALLKELEPAQAQSIVSFLLDLRDVHRAQPSYSGEPAQFDRLLWLLTLTWAVERSGSEFNRKVFLLSLLHKLAENEGLDFAAVTHTFRLGLARVILRVPLRSSLPAILAAVIADLDRTGPTASDADRADADRDHGFGEILNYVEGANRKALESLLDAIESLSGADRPDAEMLRSIMLAETLRWNPDREMDQSFFERLLRNSFPQPLPERVRSSLLRAAPESAPGLRAALLTPDSAQPNDRYGRSPDAIIASLLAREGDSVLPDDALILELEASLERNTDVERVRQRLANARARHRLVRILPQSAWKTMIRALEPGRSHALEEAEPILAAAWALARPGSRDPEIRHAIRTAMLEAIAEGACSVTTLTTHVLRQVQKIEPKDPEAEVRFRMHIGRLAEGRGVSSLRSSTAASSPLPAMRRKNSVRMTPPPEPDDQSIYIANAGIVLTSPFLPHLFATLGMLENGEKVRAAWRRPQDAMRAVHLLQYLVDDRTSAPEPQLVFNKILCGLPTAAPLERAVELTGQEMEICGQLLNAMIANWPVLSGSSPAALRETFFQREGRLTREDGVWKLRVQRRTLDVLLDQIPWSYKTILHDWMQETVHVTW